MTTNMPIGIFCIFLAFVTFLATLYGLGSSSSAGVIEALTGFGGTIFSGFIGVIFVKMHGQAGKELKRLQEDLGGKVVNDDL